VLFRSLGKQKQTSKVIVMPCLIELGEAGERVHREIGQKINDICDLAIITTSDYFNIIKNEAGDKAVLAIKPEKVIELLKDKLNSDVVVLIEGRVAESIVNFAK
jgi:UDP-N-acetylmuramyl pentapeptide synthase